MNYVEVPKSDVRWINKPNEYDYTRPFLLRAYRISFDSMALRSVYGSIRLIVTGETFENLRSYLITGTKKGDFVRIYIH